MEINALTTAAPPAVVKGSDQGGPKGAAWLRRSAKKVDRERHQGKREPGTVVAKELCETQCHRKYPRKATGDQGDFPVVRGNGREVSPGHGCQTGHGRLTDVGSEYG